MSCCSSCSTSARTGCSCAKSLLTRCCCQRSSKASARQADTRPAATAAPIHSSRRGSGPAAGVRRQTQLDSPLPEQIHCGKRAGSWRPLRLGQATEPEQARAVAFAGPSESAAFSSRSNQPAAADRGSPRSRPPLAPGPRRRPPSAGWSRTTATAPSASADLAGARSSGTGATPDPGPEGRRAGDD